MLQLTKTYECVLPVGSHEPGWICRVVFQDKSWITLQNRRFLTGEVLFENGSGLRLLVHEKCRRGDNQAELKKGLAQ